MVASATPLQQYSSTMPWLELGAELEGLPCVEEGHVAQAFREIDYDGMGFIGVSELRYLLTLMGEGPKDDELDEMVSMFDQEGNGKISYEDFCELFRPGNPVHTEMLQMAPEEVSETLASQKAKDRRKRVTNKQEVNLMVRTAAGFMYGNQRREQNRERRKAMPKPKREVLKVPDTGLRCRPAPAEKPVKDFLIGQAGAVPPDPRMANAGKGNGKGKDHPDYLARGPNYSKKPPGDSPSPGSPGSPTGGRASSPTGTDFSGSRTDKSWTRSGGGGGG